LTKLFLVIHAKHDPIEKLLYVACLGKKHGKQQNSFLSRPSAASNGSLVFTAPMAVPN
jgi:hypothetical protein